MFLIHNPFNALGLFSNTSLIVNPLIVGLYVSGTNKYTFVEDFVPFELVKLTCIYGLSVFGYNLIKLVGNVYVISCSCSPLLVIGIEYSTSFIVYFISSVTLVFGLVKLNVTGLPKSILLFSLVLFDIFVETFWFC